MAARATIKKATIQNTPPFAGHFDGPGGAPELYRAHRPIEEGTRSDITQSDMLTPDFGGIFHRQINKRARVDI